MKMVSVLLVMCAVGACQVKPSMTVQGSPNNDSRQHENIESSLACETQHHHDYQLHNNKEL